MEGVPQIRLAYGHVCKELSSLLTDVQELSLQRTASLPRQIDGPELFLKRELSTGL